jgi:hypothetical protein
MALHPTIGRLRRPLAGERQSVEAGAGLYDCQGLEYSTVAYLLFLLSRLAVPGLNPADTMAILDHEAKKTAGQLVALFRRRTTLSDGIEEALADALDARNELVHRCFTANLERLVERQTMRAP